MPIIPRHRILLPSKTVMSFCMVVVASDAWIDDLLDAVDLTGKQIVRMMDCVEVLNEEHVEGMEAEDDHEQNIPDEHVWTAPQNAILITKSIAAAICTADPTHEEEYQAREAAYLDQLDELDQQFIQLVNGAVRHTLVFGDRFPLRYFVEAYDLDYYAAFIGLFQRNGTQCRYGGLSHR